MVDRSMQSAHLDEILQGKRRYYHPRSVSEEIRRLTHSERAEDKGHPLETWLSWRSFDKWGNHVKEEDTEPVPARSYTLNFLKILQIQMNAEAGFTVQEVDATNTAWVVGTDIYFANAGSTIATYGIVVGTGTNVVDESDIALQTKIAHGTGAGQLQHGAMSIAGPGISGADTTAVLSRAFTNGTGSTITVQEVALYIGDDAGPADFFMILRDLSTQAILAGATKTASLTLKTTT